MNATTITTGKTKSKTAKAKAGKVKAIKTGRTSKSGRATAKAITKAESDTMPVAEANALAKELGELLSYDYEYKAYTYPDDAQECTEIGIEDTDAFYFPWYVRRAIESLKALGAGAKLIVFPSGHLFAELEGVVWEFDEDTAKASVTRDPILLSRAFSVLGGVNLGSRDWRDAQAELEEERAKRAAEQAAVACALSVSGFVDAARKDLAAMCVHFAAADGEIDEDNAHFHAQRRGFNAAVKGMISALDAIERAAKRADAQGSAGPS